jgi:flagellar biosynthesis protein FlhB
MAAKDDGQERTESATPRRREEAHREGRVPRSQELSAATLLLAGTGVLALAGGTSLARHSLDVMRTDIAWLSAQPLNALQAATILQQLGRTTLLALAPFLVGILAVTLLVNGVQARGIVSVEPLGPKLSHIDPVAGLGRTFSLDAVVNLLKALVKFALLGLVTYLVLKRAWPEVLSSGGADVPVILGLTRTLAVRMALLAGLAFLAIAALDYGYQVWQYEKNLRMTRHEVTQEHKETEGDPQIKGRVRQLQRQMARKRMLGKVATADVVVTNPTHIAVALKYDPLISAAPIVVAMGERLLAQRIKDIAHRAGVPVIENKPLARALLASARVNEAIPAALYVAVAEVIAFVFRRKGVPLPRRRDR